MYDRIFPFLVAHGVNHVLAGVRAFEVDCHIEGQLGLESLHLSFLILVQHYGIDENPHVLYLEEVRCVTALMYCFEELLLVFHVIERADGVYGSVVK